MRLQAAKMQVYIANFGRNNHLWPICFAYPSVATVEDEDLRGFWLAGNRQGYIECAISSKKTAGGLTPTPSVASRWFNLAHIISNSADDLWIHREKNELWWTHTRADEVDVSGPEFDAEQGERVYILHKPTTPWSSTTRTGRLLEWKALHPKAQHFLFTEGTLQKPSPDNATYAIALINGDILDSWELREEWKKAAASSRRGTAKVFTAQERSAARMAVQARDTAAQARGQQVVRTVKAKDLRFVSQHDFEAFLLKLIEAQDGVCALTGLPLQFDGEQDDSELLCSLDRVDSSGHYEDGNLQVVCRFANRWKNDGENAEFRRLIKLIRDLGSTD